MQHSKGFALTRHPFRQRIGREVVKTALSSLLRWRPLQAAGDGFTVILGVPWDLRHLLSVNLRFVAKTDLSHLKKLFVVFDRRKRQEMAEIEERTRREFPMLPLEFLCYPPAAGWLIEKVHVSTFYNSMNTTLALGRCETKHAVLHDFDLYPLRKDHFTSIVDAMRANTWRFSGHEFTHFDGLEDQDRQIGTWTLGIDVEWLRSQYRPTDCFHRVSSHRGRQFNLDPFAWIQFQTPQRGLTQGFDDMSFCHVKNLCSAYLRFLKRAPLQVAWRLHYLWYLESLSGLDDRMSQVTRAMEEATSAVLHVDRLPADFTGVHVTCVNVLRTELTRMDRALFGQVRSETATYLESFKRFLMRFGSSDPLRRSDGTIEWTLEMAGAFGSD